MRPALAIAVVCLLLAGGCGEAVDRYQAGDGRVHEYPHPIVERDLPRIRQVGVLRMITYYDSSSYFVHKGGQAGFDYELLARFAREQNLTLEVVVPGEGEDVVSLLNSGRGDVFCPGSPPEAEWLRWTRSTRPTNFVRKTVVLPDTTGRPPTLEALAGLVITLPAGDPFRKELMGIRRHLVVPFVVAQGPAGATVDDLLEGVRNGALEATALDDVVARAAVVHAPGLVLGANLGEVRPASWLVREDCPELLTALNHYLKNHLQVAASGRTRRSRVYGIIYNRYFQDRVTVRDFRVPAHRPDKSGRLSPWDEEIRAHAEAAGLDWRLVVSLVYQESRFNPDARSRADARGLMQVLPRVAGVQADSLYVPAANLRAGMRLLTGSWQKHAYLDSLERVRFTLAEYHAGTGHLTDARRIALDLGRNPNAWSGSLAETLPLLTQERYHRRTRHGFYGGDRTVLYVKEILARYRAYQRLVPRETQPVAEDPIDPLAPLLFGGRRVVPADPR
ncbi:MAG: transglycosylase SLT domain-containing protein [bacterium]|nr:transglycosylase SLT domain-containing protein [bacterium]